MKEKMTTLLNCKHKVRIVLLLFFPVLYFFSHQLARYKEMVLTKDVLTILLIYLTIPFFIFFILIIANSLTPLKAAVVTFSAMLIFLFFGAIQDMLLKLGPENILNKSLTILLASFVIIIFLGKFLKKSQEEPLLLTRYLNTVFITLTLFEIGSFGYSLASGKSIHQITHRMVTSGTFPENTLVNRKPDIYHIIFDGYSSPLSLLKNWNYNDTIYSFLQKKGFYTIDSATSNYNFTPYSLSSIFNLQYLKNADAYQERNSANFQIGCRLFIENALFKFLKNNGYKVSLFSLIVNPDQIRALGDMAPGNPERWIRKETLERIWLNPWIKQKLIRFFHPSRKIPESVRDNFAYSVTYNRDAINHIKSDLQLISQHQPIFSFTHFMLPHEPYVFTEFGETGTNIQNNQKLTGYIAQTKYANLVIKEICNLVFADTSREKIVIIQGDHGYRDYPGDVNIREQYKTLNAIYFFDRNYSYLTKSTSLVNTYRIIANQYFNIPSTQLIDSIDLPDR